MFLHPETAKKLFNLRHSSPRNIVERTFSIFNNRFQVFNTAPKFPTNVQAKLVYAATAFHSQLINTSDIDDSEIVDWERDPDKHFDTDPVKKEAESRAASNNAMAKKRDEISVEM